MQQQDKKRREVNLIDNDEPTTALGLTTPSSLTRRPRAKGRKRPPRPSEKRRRRRQISVTFSTEAIPTRLRDLAQRWELTAPDGQSPNLSALVEYLLAPQIEAAEAGEIDPPGKG